MQLSRVCGQRGLHKAGFHCTPPLQCLDVGATESLSLLRPSSPGESFIEVHTLRPHASHEFECGIFTFDPCPGGSTKGSKASGRGLYLEILLDGNCSIRHCLSASERLFT
ncbi:unnamed protein product [Chondrus crispus]|uniref:Uncharacterized protein n=1 Tax=Chondrus crispus TaxID=2769 RepID=R7QJX5_CHOCR|nr:unnamed protein product [Chondrus crispus]CDF38827.1 unnamed protein product [Chondrus crispus]|eukprot:XP_005718732.1 unnamed protein product [Chondrus crispus]